jgi:hypothetical protein
VFADPARGPHSFVGHLGDCNWLDGVFNPGDFLMVAVLRRLNRSGIRRLYTLSSNCSSSKSMFSGKFLGFPNGWKNDPPYG